MIVVVTPKSGAYRGAQGEVVRRTATGIVIRTASGGWQGFRLSTVTVKAVR